VLSRIFGPKKREIRGRWRKLLNEDETYETCTTNGKMKNVSKNIFRKPIEKVWNGFNWLRRGSNSKLLQV
jgi:hypothetical protein